ncbi:MAG: winged helix-turn-helix transcriptional regulator [Candidatus Hodarchaeota archaeon]
MIVTLMELARRSKESVENCPVYLASRILGKRWTLLILQTLLTPEAKKGLRYSQLQRRLNWVSPKVLTQRLRELESEGIAKRSVDASVIPPNVSYSLTKKGRDLEGIIRLIQEWGRQYGGKKVKKCLSHGFENCHSCEQE